MTVKEYVQALRSRQIVIARKLGCDISMMPKADRVLNVSLLCLLAVLIKTLVDKGLITDADLLATLNAARDDTYDDEPMDPGPSA